MAKKSGRRHKSRSSQRAAQYRTHKWTLNTLSYQTLPQDQSESNSKNHRNSDGDTKTLPLPGESPSRQMTKMVSRKGWYWEQLRGNAVAQLSVPTVLQMQQEISCLTLQWYRHCQQGNRPALSCYFGNIFYPAEILLALLSFNFRKTITAGYLSPIWQLQECSKTVLRPYTLNTQGLWATDSECRY